jgi:nucleoside-diphosphate-sugar epimerase
LLQLQRKIEIMPRLLIAGCGYLGRAVADLFLSDEWEVEAWTMSPESVGELSERPYQSRAVDISEAKEVAAHNGDFDVVLHCASTRGGDIDAYRRVYANGARNLLERFRGAKLLFTSSTSVYAQTGGEWVTEESAAHPNTESGKILRESEKLVLSSGGIVIRLGGIYGPGRSALLKKFLSGEAILDSGNDRFLNAIHRDDAALAVRLLAVRNGNDGQIYNVVDNEPTLQSECYRWLAARLNRSLPPVGRAASPRKRGHSNKRVSNAKLRAVGWAPRYPNFVVGMEKSVLPSFSRDLA